MAFRIQRVESCIMNEWVSNGNWEPWHSTPGFSNKRTGWGKGRTAHSPPPWGMEEGILQLKYFIPIFPPKGEMLGGGGGGRGDILFKISRIHIKMEDK